MKLSSENYQNSISAMPDRGEAAMVGQTEKGSGNTQTVKSSSSKDSVEISGQAAKIARAELREQAALARIQMLKQQNASITQTDAQAENEGSIPEDPLTVFINTMFKMMEERQEIQLKNAAEQAEKQKEEMDAAILELENARAEKKAAQEETTVTTDTPSFSKPVVSTGSPAESGAKTESDNAARNGQEQQAATYGKKGTPAKTGFIDTNNKGTYRATA